MQGVIVRQMISEGALAATHGFRFPIHRLVIPEHDNLTITPYRNHVYVWSGKGLKGDVVAEVAVPEELVKKAQEVLVSQASIKDIFNTNGTQLYGYFGGQ